MVANAERMQQCAQASKRPDGAATYAYTLYELHVQAVVCLLLGDDPDLEADAFIEADVPMPSLAAAFAQVLDDDAVMPPRLLRLATCVACICCRYGNRDAAKMMLAPLVDDAALVSRLIAGPSHLSDSVVRALLVLAMHGAPFEPDRLVAILRAALHAARLVAEHHDQRTMLRTIRDVSRRILHAAQ